jgi:PPP family 3-phenylpropionic acid transporter
VRVGAFLACCSFAGVFWGDSFLWLALVMVLFSFFWNATLPQYEVITLNQLGQRPHLYTAVRLWGSIGFILAVTALGPLLDRHGVQLLPWVVLTLMAGIWLSSLLAPADKRIEDHDNPVALKHVLLQPHVLALMAVCFFMQASHGPYYTFYSIYLESHDYSRSIIGQLWALGVAAEVALFVVMSRYGFRFSLKKLLMASLALTSVRWVIIGMFPDKLALLLFAQCLHAASFGLYHAVAIQFFHQVFIGRHQGRGQAIYSSISFGAGGALGSFCSGFLWEGSGPKATYLIASLVSLTAFFVAWRWLKDGRSQAAGQPEASVQRRDVRENR